MLGIGPLEVGAHVVDCLSPYLSLGPLSATCLIPFR